MQFKTILRSLIVISLIGSFCYYLTYNKKGIRAYFNHKQEIAKEQDYVKKLNTQIVTLQHACDVWDTDPFEREKLARQELQMSYTNEYVYFTHS